MLEDIRLTIRVPHSVGREGTPAEGSLSEFVLDAVPANSVVKAIAALPPEQRDRVVDYVLTGSMIPEQHHVLLSFFEWCYRNLSHPTREQRTACESRMRAVARSLGKLEAYFPGNPTEAPGAPGAIRDKPAHDCSSLCWQTDKGHHNTLVVETIGPGDDVGTYEAEEKDIVTALCMATDELRARILSQLPEGRQLMNDGVPQNEWEKSHPKADIVLQLAMGRGEGLVDLRGAVRHYTGACDTALLRCRSAINYYNGQMLALIENQDYTEILHHIGHIESECVTIERITREKLAVMREAQGEVVPPLPEPPELSAAAEALFDMMHLYAGYSVTHRGPIGLIHRALREIHPESQTMLASGASVADVRQRFWPTDDEANPIEPPNPPVDIPWMSRDHERLADDNWEGLSQTQVIDQAILQPTLEKALSHVAIWETDRAVREAFRRARSGERTSYGGLWEPYFETVFHQLMLRYPIAALPRTELHLDSPEAVVDYFIDTEKMLRCSEEHRELASRAFNAAHTMIGGGLDKDMVLNKWKVAKELLQHFEFRARQ